MGALERISATLGRWDRARERASYRRWGALLGLLLGGLLLLLPTPSGLSPEGHATAAVALVMALWWVGAVLPMAVTALLPLLAFPLLGVASTAEAAAPYAHPLNFLMLGGFVLGHAVERVGLHERLVAALLAPAWVRASPRRIALALMVVTAGLSGIVSNTATTLMMLPIAVELGRLACEGERRRTSFILALAYAASIGGVWSLVGTPPNAVLAGLAPEEAGVQIGFARWMGLGLPFSLLALPVAWVVVTRLALPLPARSARPIAAPRAGRMRPGEGSVIGVLVAAMLLWALRRPIDLGGLRVPGWSDLLVHGQLLHDAFVAIGAAGLLFLLPGPVDDRGRRRPLLRWAEVEDAVPWSVLLLLGGGFSLAAAISSSGLTAWIAARVGFLHGVPLPVAVGIICLGMTLITELTSNTASTQIALPLLAAAAVQAGVEPLLWMVPATVSASCAFMMPVATAPNAIASQAGRVSPGDMALAGLVLNLLLVGLATALCVWIVPTWT